MRWAASVIIFFSTSESGRTLAVKDAVELCEAFMARKVVKGEPERQSKSTAVQHLDRVFHLGNGVTRPAGANLVIFSILINILTCWMARAAKPGVGGIAPARIALSCGT